MRVVDGQVLVEPDEAYNTGLLPVFTLLEAPRQLSMVRRIGLGAMSLESATHLVGTPFYEGVSERVDHLIEVHTALSALVLEHCSGNVVEGAVGITQAV